MGEGFKPYKIQKGDGYYNFYIKSILVLFKQFFVCLMALLIDWEFLDKKYATTTKPFQTYARQ